MFTKEWLKAAQLGGEDCSTDSRCGYRVSSSLDGGNWYRAVSLDSTGFCPCMSVGSEVRRIRIISALQVRAVLFVSSLYNSRK